MTSYSKVKSIKAIRRKCYECMGGNMDSMVERSVWRLVNECPSSTCPLFLFRLGVDPYKRVPTTAQREAQAINLSKGLRAAGSKSH